MKKKLRSLKQMPLLPISRWERIERNTHDQCMLPTITKTHEIIDQWARFYSNDMIFTVEKRTTDCLFYRIADASDGILEFVAKSNLIEEKT